MTTTPRTSIHSPPPGAEPPEGRRPAGSFDDQPLPEPTGEPVNLAPRPAGELAALEAVWRTPRGWRLPSSVNNTVIGLFYIGTALLFFLLAGVLGLLMRAQLAVPENTLLSAGTYNQVFTMHGTVMMFLFAVPVVEAIAVFLLPNMLGARDLPFPRLSAYAFWAYAIGGLVFYCTLFVGLSPDGGWFMYPPLTGKEHSPGLNADFWLLGIGFIEISAIAGAIELIIGILFTRAPGMTLGRMPIYAWTMLVVGVMIVFAFPPVIAGTALLELERAFDWPFFIAARGGDPLLWQHLFWFFGHPEVYIIFLPAAGMVSMIVPTMARVPLAGYRLIVVALVGVGVFGFGLWSHHMFTAGLGALSMSLISAASMAVAVPSGIQVFAWMATLRRGRLRFDAPALFVLGFLFLFVLGGLTGVMVAIVPFDWQVHDSYFVVAHFHYVLIGGMVFPMFAALYYWAPLVNGHRLSERLARWVFGLMFAGFNLAFFPMHISGLLGMPRRVHTYAPDLGWNLWNLLSSIGAFVFAAGVVLFAVDAWRTWRKDQTEHGNPWNAPSLEWVPSESYSLRSIPSIASRYPLWDRPRLAEEVVAGQHWLPGTGTGARETIITSPVRAVPRHVIVLPGDSWLPFLAAVGTAGFFLLLTVKLNVVAFLMGIIAIMAIVLWLWQTDHSPRVSAVQVADRVTLAVGAAGAASHSWWAMVVLLVVDGTIFASMLFAHVHVSLRAEVCPPPGAALAPIGWPLAAGLAGIAGSTLVEWTRRRVAAAPGGSPAWVVWSLAAAIACATGAYAFEFAGWRAAGLAPRADAWSATIAAMSSYQGLHALVLTMMGGYTLVRAHAGRLTSARRATIDNTALLWHYTTLQGIVAAVAVQALPPLMNGSW